MSQTNGSKIFKIYFLSLRQRWKNIPGLDQSSLFCEQRSLRSSQGGQEGDLSRKIEGTSARRVTLHFLCMWENWKIWTTIRHNFPKLKLLFTLLIVIKLWELKIFSSKSPGRFPFNLDFLKSPSSCLFSTRRTTSRDFVARSAASRPNITFCPEIHEVDLWQVYI